MFAIRVVACALLSFGTSLLLAASSGAAPSDHNPIPLGLARAPIARGANDLNPAKQGTGAFGVAVFDYLGIEGSSDPNPVACSGPPSDCDIYVPKKKLKDSIKTSHYYGSGWVKTTTALGSLTASAFASEAGKGQQSSLAAANIAAEDTFTITSKTLPAGTPVRFTASIQITGCTVPCKASGTGAMWLGISTSYSGLSFTEDPSSSPTPVLSATLNTTVGAQFTDALSLTLSLDAGGEYIPGKVSSGTQKVVYHLDPITSGASYVTASGESYL